MHHRDYPETGDAARLSPEQLAIAVEALEREFEDAREAGEVGFMARLLVQATMPHSDPKTLRVERRNGFVTLRMTALGPGLPYGGLPRLLLAWVTTEAVRKREREIVLGSTLSSFMEQLGLTPTGGRWGSIPRLRNQMRRLFSSALSAEYDGRGRWGHQGIVVADEVHDFWDPKEPHQAGLWQSKVVLGERFFAEIVDRPVPVDLSALRTLKRSPLALDMYAWLTYRMSYLRQSLMIPWEAMRLQFGDGYSTMWHFRAEFRRALRSILTVYSQARVEVVDSAGVCLHPSPTHIATLRRART